MKLLPFLGEHSDDMNKTLVFLSRVIVVESAVKVGLIEDNDLANVPETIPILTKLVEELRDDYYHDVRSLSPNGQLSFQVMQKCFCYCFAKGAEAAYQWDVNPPGKLTISYSKDDALEGRAGANVPQEFANIITTGMISAEDVFCELQDNYLVNPDLGLLRGGRLLADGIACGFFWAAMVGLDYGMNARGYK